MHKIKFDFKKHCYLVIDVNNNTIVGETNTLERAHALVHLFDKQRYEDQEGPPYIPITKEDLIESITELYE